MDKKFFNLQLFAKVAKVSLTADDDVESNLDDNKIIYALGGNDDVTTGFKKNNVTVYGGKGNDSIGSNWYNYDGNGNNLLMLGEAGNDYLHSVADNKVTMSGGAGKDTITCDSGAEGIFSENFKLYGGAGDDSISFTGCKKVVVTGDAGNDYISDFVVDKITVTGGKGNDTLELSEYSKNHLIKYASGDGNDIIYGFDSNDTIQITSGSYSTTKSGSDFIIKVGKQKITLKDAVETNRDKIHIKDSSGKVSVYNDWTILKGAYEFVNTANKVKISMTAKENMNNYVTNFGDQVSIKGSGLGEYIYNYYGTKVTINGGKGTDWIWNKCGDNAKLLGGDGIDTISDQYSNKVSINGGAGDDIIGCFSDTNCTVTGGKGNDSIDCTGSTSKVITYASGDGNDTVSGFFEDDILKITKGTYKVTRKDGDVIVTVGNGSIRLLDAARFKISIMDSNGKTKTYSKNISSTAALFEENNFVTADNLDSITKNNLTPTALEKISSINYDSLTQENNLITFSDK